MILSLNLKLEDDKFSSDRKNFDPYSQESYFKRARYYLKNRENESFHLYSEELIQNQTLGELILTGPNGVIFDSDNEPFYYSGNSGFFNLKTHNLILKQNVIVRSKEALIKGDMLHYQVASNVRLDVTGNVLSQTQNYDKLYEIRVTSEKLSYFPNAKKLDYEGGVKGKVQRKRKFEVPVFFESNKMSFFMPEKKATMTGDVLMKKQELTGTARSGELFFENYNKKLKYFALYDDVTIKEQVAPAGKKPFERRAFSEKLEGYTSENKIVLLGYPKVYQNNDVLKGNVIVLRENNETIEVDDANTNFIVE